MELSALDVLTLGWFTHKQLKSRGILNFLSWRMKEQLGAIVDLEVFDEKVIRRQLNGTRTIRSYAQLPDNTGYILERTYGKKYLPSEKDSVRHFNPNGAHMHSVSINYASPSTVNLSLSIPHGSLLQRTEKHEFELFARGFWCENCIEIISQAYKHRNAQL